MGVLNEKRCKTIVWDYKGTYGSPTKYQTSSSPYQKTQVQIPLHQD